MTERKYQMVKLRAGDYLLPSNSGKTLLRVSQYKDGRSYGLMDMKGNVLLWHAARYDGTLEQASHDDDLEHSERWVILAGGWMKTRQEAINAALETAERRGI